MTHPLLLLLIALALFLVLALFFRPEKGLAWRWFRLIRIGERIQVEDALKHAYHCESGALPLTLDSLSGALGITGNHAAEVVTRLLAMGLLQNADGKCYALTDEGRREALRIVRIHRLWERYLSDATGHDEREWHRVAELKEHTTTEAQVAALDSQLGYPRFDPHGDPIPTPDGEVIEAPGRPLTDLKPGDVAEIVHIEDEPESLYAQLVAAGVYLGQVLRMVENTATRCRVESDMEEYVFAPVLAANLSVRALDPGETFPASQPRLSTLGLGQDAVIAGISSRCRAPERRRLYDMGILPQTQITAEMRAPSGTPTAYRVRGALVALRPEQSDLIFIKAAPSAENTP